MPKSADNMSSYETDAEFLLRLAKEGLAKRKAKALTRQKQLGDHEQQSV